MEIVFEFFGELIGPFISIAIGFGLGSLALLVMLGIRRAHQRMSRSVEVADPEGGVWSVRVVYGLRRTTSKRLAGMSVEARGARRRAGRTDTAVGRDEIWHPRRIVDRHDELAGIIAPFVLIAAVLIVVIFIAELVIAVPVGIAVFVISTVRGRWRVEVTNPDGTRSITETASLDEARELRAHLADQIVGGAEPSLP